MSCRISTHGTPGLVPVSGLAVAGWLDAKAQYIPAVAKAVIAKRVVVRDMSSSVRSTLMCLGPKVA
jgi:hypothetical protein